MGSELSDKVSVIMIDREVEISEKEVNSSKVNLFRKYRDVKENITYRSS